MYSLHMTKRTNIFADLRKIRGLSRKYILFSNIAACSAAVTMVRQVIFICSCVLNPSLLAGCSMTTTRSNKLLPRALHHRRHQSTMKGYKNWCNAMTSASTIVEIMSKSSVRYVHQMAIYMACNTG